MVCSRRLQPAGIPPQSFEVVVSPGGRIEEVDHHIPVVEQYPLPRGPPLAPQEFAPYSTQVFLYRVCQRQHMNPRGATGDYEHVRDHQQISYIQDCDPLALLGIDGCRRFQGERFRFRSGTYLKPRIDRSISVPDLLVKVITASDCRPWGDPGSELGRTRSPSPTR